MIKKVLVTGCSGFIGKEVCDFFLSKNYKVYGLDKVKNTNLNKILFFKCDIMNKENLLKIFKEINEYIKNIPNKIYLKKMIMMQT